MSSTSDIEASKVSPDQAIKKRGDAQADDNANANNNKRAREEADPTAIRKYITTDLWSDDSEVVGKALESLVNLVCDEGKSGDENIKTICSLAGHMMILAALKKHIDIKNIILDALEALDNIIRADKSVSGPLVSAGAIEVVLRAIETDMENSDTESRIPWNAALIS